MRGSLGPAQLYLMALRVCPLSLVTVDCTAIFLGSTMVGWVGCWVQLGRTLSLPLTNGGYKKTIYAAKCDTPSQIAKHSYIVGSCPTKSGRVCWSQPFCSSISAWALEKPPLGSREGRQGLNIAKNPCHALFNLILNA